MKQIAELIEGQTLTVLGSDDNVRAAAKRMVERNIGAAAVVDNGKLSGIFSERDLMSRVVAPGLDPDSTAVGDVMTRELVVIEPEADIDSAIQQMHSIGSRHLPVVEDGKLVGMLSIRDLLEVDDADQRRKATFLRDLVTYSPDYES
jgi:CBS domain-containing protein